jgi:hypothetical protein
LLITLRTRHSLGAPQGRGIGSNRSAGIMAPDQPDNSADEHRAQQQSRNDGFLS